MSRVLSTINSHIINQTKTITIMKKFMLFCLMALGTMVSFTSCGDDDDKDIEQGDINVGKANFQESGDKMVATWTLSYGSNLSVKIVWTSTFSGNTLKSSIMEYTYPSADMAKIAYQELQEEGEKVSISGKTVKYDVTDEFKDYGKDEMRIIMQESTKQEYYQ